ncbi:hypothetical protein AX16_003157 [Volvariella volvacea WC 439]|nr:hypothetical protein AX16_003157 [Volvariella volvacea WC 439]
MAGSFNQYLTAALTPKPYLNPVEYDGLEYRWKFFVFRPAYFKIEAYLLAAIVFYVVASFFGGKENNKRATTWLKAHLPLYEQQFSSPSVKGLTQDGNSDFFNFSTGRRNIASLHTVFTLRPRHDFVQWLFQTLRTSLVDLHYRAEDQIQLDFKLLPGALPDNFVWAVVAKDNLLWVKSDRWDLTFTKTTENPALPSTMSVMSEFADVTDNLFKPFGNFSLLAALQNSKIQPYFRSLSITDQPRSRPSKPVPVAEREKHVILNLVAPPSSDVTATVDLVAAIFSMIDALNKINLRPETKAKLRKVREDLDVALKEDAEREKKEELAQAVEDKKAAKRKAEQERIAKLPAAEQQKILEKERKQTLRKSQTKAKAMVRA